MTEVSYKQLWIEAYQRDRNDMAVIIERDPFNDWDKIRFPEISVSWALQNALDILYSGTDPELAYRFLSRCVAIIERTERDGKLDAQKRDVGSVLERAEFYRAKALTLAVSTGGTHADLFRQSGQDFLAWIAKDKHSSTWHDQDEAYFLAASGAHLICDDVERANELFQRYTKTNWIRIEARLWRDLCAEWLADGRVSEPLKLMLWNRFDEIRRPQYQPKMFMRLTEFRLEFGAIVWKYVLENKGAIDWNAVIELVSR
jgi:hypothetical protein